VNHIILKPSKRRITLQEKELLENIPGIGEVSSHTLVAELPDLSEFSNTRQLAAHSRQLKQ